MNIADVCWLATGAYGAHILEEASFHWVEWARSISGLNVSKKIFYWINAAVLLLGVLAAFAAERFPVLAMAYFMLMLINGTFFHLGAFLWKRRYSPGLFTSIFLFYPVSYVGLRAANSEALLTPLRTVESLLLGAAFMSVPLIVFRLANRTRGGA